MKIDATGFLITLAIIVCVFGKDVGEGAGKMVKAFNNAIHGETTQ